MKTELNNYQWLFAVVMILNVEHCLSQQQFRHKYRFKNKFNITYILQEKIPGVGGAAPIYRLRGINANCELAGQFTMNDAKDTIFIKPWTPPTRANLIDRTVTPNTAIVSTTNTYIVTNINWQTDCFRHLAINIPYKTYILTAINIPIRIDFISQKAIADFLNVGLAGYCIHGRRKIFQSDFVEPRNKFIGFGGYVGARAIDEEKTVGLNYGGSIVLSLNNIHTIIAIGNESGFNVSDNLWNPYVGIGLGVKLIDLVAD